jgi:hypothetical protein
MHGANLKNAPHLLLINELLLCGSKFSFMKGFYIFEMLEMALSIFGTGQD